MFAFYFFKFDLNYLIFGLFVGFDVFAGSTGLASKSNPPSFKDLILFISNPFFLLISLKPESSPLVKL